MIADRTENLAVGVRNEVLNYQKHYLVTDTIGAIFNVYNKEPFYGLYLRI